MGQEGIASGEDRYVLLYDRLEEGGHQLLSRHSEFLEAVDIRFGKDAALGGDGVELVSKVPHLGELLRGDVELCVNLVYDCPRPSCTLVVHGGDLPLPFCFDILLEDDNLRVLTAEFDDRAALGEELLHRQGDGVDLLNESRADLGSDPSAAGACDVGVAVVRFYIQFPLDPLEEFEGLLLLLALVALVVLPDDRIRLAVDYYRLDGGRTDIHADVVSSFIHIL